MRCTRYTSSMDPGRSVVRLVYNPPTEDDPVPYAMRGWRFFESTAASIGCVRLKAIKDGVDCEWTLLTPVP